MGITMSFITYYVVDSFNVQETTILYYSRYPHSYIQFKLHIPLKRLAGIPGVLLQDFDLENYLIASFSNV